MQENTNSCQVSRMLPRAGIGLVSTRYMGMIHRNIPLTIAYNALETAFVENVGDIKA